MEDPSATAQNEWDPVWDPNYEVAPVETNDETNDETDDDELAICAEYRIYTTFRVPRFLRKVGENGEYGPIGSWYISGETLHYINKDGKEVEIENSACYDRRCWNGPAEVWFEED